MKNISLKNMVFILSCLYSTWGHAFNKARFFKKGCVNGLLNKQPYVWQKSFPKHKPCSFEQCPRGFTTDFSLVDQVARLAKNKGVHSAIEKFDLLSSEDQISLLTSKYLPASMQTVGNWEDWTFQKFTHFYGKMIEHVDDKALLNTMVNNYLTFIANNVKELSENAEQKRDFYAYGLAKVIKKFDEQARMHGLENNFLIKQIKITFPLELRKNIITELQNISTENKDEKEAIASLQKFMEN